ADRAPRHRHERARARPDRGPPARARVRPGRRDARHRRRRPARARRRAPRRPDRRRGWRVTRLALAGLLRAPLRTVVRVVVLGAAAGLLGAMILFIGHSLRTMTSGAVRSVPLDWQ